MAYDFTQLEDEIKDAEEWLSKEMLSLHTGRATPAILDRVLVESYGSRQPIQHVANISVLDARTLHIVPWDKNMVKEIEKAIVSSDLRLSVSQDEQGVIVSFPELTAERKDDLKKTVNDKLEEARVSVRQARDSVWDDIQEQQKSGDITEDEKFRYKDKLQEYVDAANKKLEDIAERKKKELSE